MITPERILHVNGDTFRTFAAFEQHLSKGILLDATTYIIPIEICSMVNVVLDAKTQALKLCGVDGVDMVSVVFYFVLRHTGEKR